MDNCEKIVIATLDCEKALYIIAKAAMNMDRIEIHYVGKYAPTVEYIVRMLWKAFGWEEVDRGSNEVTNTKCRFKHMGTCKHPERDNEGLKCNEAVRSNCGLYVAKYDYKIKVNRIVVEKLGAIRQ